jgi:hypothetical protein
MRQESARNWVNLDKVVHGRLDKHREIKVTCRSVDVANPRTDIMKGKMFSAPPTPGV